MSVALRMTEPMSARSMAASPPMGEKSTPSHDRLAVEMSTNHIGLSLGCGKPGRRYGRGFG